MNKFIFSLLFVFVYPQISSASGKVLIILSSEDKITLQENVVHETGFFLSELMRPVKILMDKGLELEFANPSGNPATLDPISDDPRWFAGKEEYNELRTLCENLGLCGRHRTGTLSPRKLSTISDSEALQYAGIFIPGGHAPMEDLIKDNQLGHLLTTLNTANRPIALICHGVIALLSTLQSPQAFIDTLTELHELEIYANARKTEHERIAQEMETLGKKLDSLQEEDDTNPSTTLEIKIETLLIELHRKYHAFSSNKVLEEQSRERIEELKKQLKTLATNWPFASYKMTSFSTNEEITLELGGTNGILGGRVLFYPDEALQYAGANVNVHGNIWESKVVVDRNLVTGRNPNSDQGVIEEFLKLIK